MNQTKSKGAYKVPEGYFEGLSDQIMSQLPDKSPRKTISLFQRIRPWMYAAAVFIGLISIYTILLDNDSQWNQQSKGSQLVVQSNASTSSFSNFAVDDEEFLEYIEKQYINDILSDELGNME